MKRNQKVVLPASMTQVQSSHRQEPKYSVSFLSLTDWILTKSRFLKSKFILSGKETFLQDFLGCHRKLRKKVEACRLCLFEDVKRKRGTLAR